MIYIGGKKGVIKVVYMDLVERGESHGMDTVIGSNISIQCFS